MNKRGDGTWFMEESMKTLLAVICIGFLIFILGKMAYTYFNDKELEQAKDSLSKIEKDISNMNDGESLEAVIYSPSPGVIAGTWDYWVLIGFDGGALPKPCSSKGWKTCLCMCKNSWMGNYAEKCLDVGTCVSPGGKSVSSGKVEISKVPIFILVKQEKGIISFVKK